MHCETQPRLIEEVNFTSERKTKSTHPVTELLSTFSTVEVIVFHTVKNWGLRLTPSRMEKILVGVGTVNLGSNPPPNPSGNSLPGDVSDSIRVAISLLTVYTDSNLPIDLCKILLVD